MSLLQTPSTHMSHPVESNSNNFFELFIVAFTIIVVFLIISITILFFVFKEQIREKFSKKANFDESLDLSNLSEKSIENDPDIENPNLENETMTDKNYSISYSIDDQAYQRERLMNLINNYPEGILQSKLPNLTNLSKATISRRISELVEKHLVFREPRGRSILIIPKN